jgi:hypothetical protein
MLNCPFRSPASASSRKPGILRSRRDVAASSNTSLILTGCSIALHFLLNRRSSSFFVSLSLQDRIIRILYYAKRMIAIGKVLEAAEGYREIEPICACYPKNRERPLFPIKEFLRRGRAFGHARFSAAPSGALLFSRLTGGGALRASPRLLSAHPSGVKDLSHGCR